ncbi:hypothetical protein [Cohnella sp. AR92]|uniref:hypothetical protein n=1 Tax=Cohnella sp. AR92 TaxID=648716 RepID=UPI000F8D88FC|nr:hypothetical protein [Cohnella sp. AR92]RUS46722.1 hypothetical protein ELR57_13560 [Cohnella sp. AR92]
MNAPVSRNEASGERTLATNHSGVGKAIPVPTKKTGKLSWRSGRSVARTLAVGASLWSAFGVAPVQASDRMSTSSVAKAGIGTLPLLAAMGIGILVSVGAVIAFLQMTAKSKGHAEEPEEWAESEEEEAGSAMFSWRQPNLNPSGDESEGPRSS